jgi:hypothetical protein
MVLVASALPAILSGTPGGATLSRRICEGGIRLPCGGNAPEAAIAVSPTRSVAGLMGRGSR